MPSTPRPISVTIVFWGVFLLGLWNIGRFIALSQQRSLLTELDSSVDPRFRLGMALFWAIVFVGLAIGLVWKRPFLTRLKRLNRLRHFTRRAIPITLLLYAVYELSLTTFYAQAPLAQNSWRINGPFYIILILFSIWGVGRTAVNKYFEEEK